MVNRMIIAFDFGTTNIGVAIGQTITGTATVLSALKARNGIPDWKKVKKLLQEWKPELLVVGLPLNMDGTEQYITIKARQFANRLKSRFKIKIKLHDERLSTVDARANLFYHKGYRALYKNNIDSASAAVILCSWLEKHA